MNCEKFRTEIREMHVEGLLSVPLENHLADCASCRSYLLQMRRLSSGLGELTIPRPVNMQPPALALRRPRFRAANLLAAMLTMLLVGALAAYIFNMYLVEEDSGGPGTRDSILYNIGQDGVKKAVTRQNGQLRPEQSKPSPSNPSRN